MAGFELDWSCLGYLDAPYVRAAYIDDNTGRGGIILVSVETIGMARADINRIRDRLAPFIHENGIREVHILSAHNHSTIDTMGIWGPMLEDGKDDAYMEQVMTSICDVSVAAYHARKTEMCIRDRSLSGLIPSPVRGGDGNAEYLAAFSRESSDFTPDIRAVVRSALA